MENNAKMVLVMGLPGSGKSYFAKQLSSEIAAKYVGSDSVRRKEGKTARYARSDKGRIYKQMVRIAEECIKNNQPVVVDATFHLQQFRDLFVSLSQKYFCPIHWIKVIADESLIKERMNEPREDSDADFQVYLLLKNEFEFFPFPHLELQSTNENSVEMMEKAKHYLTTHHG